MDVGCGVPNLSTIWVVMLCEGPIGLTIGPMLVSHGYFLNDQGLKE